MKAFRSSNPVAAAGVAGALALGTVVSVGALSPASALSTTYDCTLPVVGATPFPVSLDNPFSAPVPAGSQVPGVPVDMDVTVLAETVGLLKFLNVTEIAGTIQDSALQVGNKDVPMKGLSTATPAALPATGDLALPMAGSTSGFTAPTTPGQYPVSLPSAFTFIPSAADGTPIVGEVECALASGASRDLGVLNVLAAGEEPEPTEKQDSTTVAKIKNAPVTVGERGRLRVRVSDEDGPAAGKVVVRLDGERLARKTLSDRGRTGVRLPKLKRGKHVVVVRYLGNAETERSGDRLRFRVRRG